MASQTFPNLPTFIRRLRIAQEITGKRRIQFTRLARKYEVSRRTIHTDVKWILRNVDLEFLQKVVLDKVLNAIEKVEEFRPDLILKYGLSFLARGVPQRIEAREQRTVEETYTLRYDLTELTDDEREELRNAARILTRSISPE